MTFEESPSSASSSAASNLPSRFNQGNSGSKPRRTLTFKRPGAAASTKAGTIRTLNFKGKKGGGAFSSARRSYDSSPQLELSDKIKRISKAMVSHYLTPPQEESEQYKSSVTSQVNIKSSNASSVSSLHDSEISDLIEALDKDATEATEQQRKDAEYKANMSFTENRYINDSANLLRPKPKTKKNDKLERLSQKRKTTSSVAKSVQSLDSETPRHFSDVALSYAVKINLYDIKVNHRDQFPITIYNSDFLKKALDKLKLPKKTRKLLKLLVKTTPFKKAYMYLFWIWAALKFGQRTFGDIDHYSGKDAAVRDLKDNRKELYRVLEEDMKLGQERRVQFIKYWRHKFQLHMYETRQGYERFLTKQVQDTLPFVLGKAIILAVLELVRFGNEVISYGDPNHC